MLHDWKMTDETVNDLLVLNSVSSTGWPGGRAPPRQSCGPQRPYKIDCKLTKLHNSCIRSTESHSWCQITPLTQSYTTSSGIFGPQTQMLPPETAAARNAPGLETD